MEAIIDTEKIKQIIADEVGEQGFITNWHGINIVDFLVEPYLQVCEDSFVEGQTLDLYVVLKEVLDSEEGYHNCIRPYIW
jgi:hypothetical protein